MHTGDQIAGPGGEGVSPQTAPSAEGRWISTQELDRLRTGLQEARETLDAIRNGEVDAVVVNGAKGSQIYSLSGADQPYRVYVEQMQEGAVTADESGLILYCNQRFAEMLGEPLERVISSSIVGILSARAWEKISSVLNDGGVVTKQEGLLPRQGGSALPVHFTASRLSLSERSLICLVVTDLSLQKSGEALRLAKEVAERASIAKDNFLATLSHELRTPLTPILMAISALQQRNLLPEGVQGDLAMIRRNIELETRLIDDLLDLTRIANGKLELHESPMDFHTVLNRAIEISRPGIEAKNQNFQVDLLADVSLTMGDPVRIEQVLSNILRNAVKFTPPGGSISIATQNPSERAIAVSISDTGIGFESSKASRLFQAFEQTDRDITRNFGGLGLGLSISKSIVTAHRGRIRGESAGPGRGATFHVELPLREAPAPAIHSRGSTAEPGERRRLKILMVEDDEDTRVILSMILKRQGHSVLAVESAKSALEAAAAQVFDLVISDLGLADQSGLELMALLRDRHSLRGIAVSGYGMEDDVRRCREAGFLHHMTKPIDPDHLLQFLQGLGAGISNASRQDGI